MVCGSVIVLLGKYYIYMMISFNSYDNVSKLLKIIIKYLNDWNITQFRFKVLVSEAFQSTDTQYEK